jgi:hypothetical protein
MELKPLKTDARQPTPWKPGRRFQEAWFSYKYGYIKTKLVCDYESTIYDFHRHNKAGMLLKTLEGLFYKTKLVCGLDSIGFSHEKMKAGMLMKTNQKAVFWNKAGMWFRFNSFKAQENESWYVDENNCVT